MTEKSKYRDWKVWNDAIDVGVQVMGLEIHDLLEIQVKQTAISIACKIAEGATGDKLGYRTAKKAAARLETYLVLYCKGSTIEVNEAKIESLLTTLESIHAQLGALMRKVSY